MAQIHNLEIDAGSTFQTQVLYTDADDVAINLTGYSARMHIRETVNNSTSPMESKYPRTITVTFEAEDGKNPMPPENVELREIPVRRYTKVTSCILPEQTFIEAVLLKPKGWAETLTPESFAEVATGLKEANARFFDYCARSLKTAEEIGVKPKV